MKKEGRRSNFTMVVLISILVFLTLLAAIVLSVGLAVLLIRTGVIVDLETATLEPEEAYLILSGISLIIGAMLTVALSMFLSRPFNQIINLTHRLSSGDFSARLSFGRIVRISDGMVLLQESLNTMAQELEQTEMLRSDFINNFSHEFKTPIVSIAGFAKLLNRGNLTPEQQKEYLAVIEAESLRLSDMATNVLNLTRVENQTILTDLTTFNLSEQIRSCVLLLESKWSKKELELDLDFGEFQIRASEELLKQVWINLLDNAVKFTPSGHTIQVLIREEPEWLTVTVRNTGTTITPEQQEKIWRKFYQADESHGAQGNGVGLAIVKRITELHKGKVSVSSENEITAFTVRLPR